MAKALRALVLVTTLAVSARLGSAQGSTSVTITEPGVYELPDLFNQADTVSLVKVVSGDTESYDVAIYKGIVVESFKGTAAGEIIYFGPYAGERLGWEYILFLRKVAHSIAPKTSSNSGYGTVHYAEVFNEGYSSMETSYNCVFDGQEVAQQCDYGVKICTDYIKLPKRTPTSPSDKNDAPFGCRWIRKSLFISLLQRLSGTNKAGELH